MALRYIEIDSTYRDRVSFPEPSSFNIFIGDTNNNNILDSSDPITVSIPIHTFTTTTGAVDETTEIGIVGSFASNNSRSFKIEHADVLSPIHDFYVGSTIFLSNDGFADAVNTETISRQITSYLILSNVSPPLVRALITVDIPFPDGFLISRDMGTEVRIISTSNPISESNSSFYITNGSDIDGFYNDYYLYNETLNESRQIISYDGTLKLAYIPTLLGSSWVYTDPSDVYSIRKELPFEIGTITSVNPIILSNTSSNIDLVGSYLRVKPALDTDGSTYQTIRITSSDGAGTVGVNGIFNPITVGDSYEILRYTRNNEQRLSFNNTLFENKTVCYELELLNLIIPNLTLTNGELKSFPYLYVQLQNAGGKSSGNNNSIIYSNNPNSSKMLFRVPIDDDCQTTCSFIKIDGDGMIQTIKLNPGHSLTFGVFLPDGTPYETIQKDTTSPIPPDRLLQICAMFSLRRMVK